MLQDDKCLVSGLLGRAVPLASAPASSAASTPASASTAPASSGVSASPAPASSAPPVLEQVLDLLQVAGVLLHSGLKGMFWAPL